MARWNEDHHESGKNLDLFDRWVGGEGSQHMFGKKRAERSKLRVIVAEDNAHDQLLFGLAAEDSPLDAIISFAEDGIDLVEKVSALVADDTPPDLIVLDLQMPRLDGHSTLSKLKEAPATAAIGVVVFSSSIHPDEVRRSLEWGALDHVVKPSTYEELLAFISSLAQFAAATETSEAA